MEKGFGLKVKIIDNIIQKKINSALASNDMSDFTFMNFKIIEYLYSNQNLKINQKDIENTLLINKSTASKILKSMEVKGLITRIAFDYDARYKQIKLLPKAEDYYKLSVSIIFKVENEIKEYLSTEELDIFENIYNKLKIL